MRQTTALLVTCLLAVKVATATPLSRWMPCEFVVCDEQYKPVCAVDETGVMQTFPNRCQFELANCESTRYHVVLKEGEC
ncbi:turripeptide Pal9.2-like [Zootermopsis nevadensis]|uniref:turripeptide Pal9.2-like n=1 Tax=Zootermopsis nevadensis TaxID=136037 RepID=UPI000B8EC9EB|nr:turripeptide Pal9.2-like [Zootermopsis nevadensis]